MTWQKLSYPQVDQEVWQASVDPWGLEVVVVPKPGFKRKYMTFSTRYGSNDRQFIPRGQTDPIAVPAGIAHFLEHQLFDQPGRNVLEELSALGVSPNAYTGHYYTVYLVSAVENWLEAFDRLLDFVQSPAFTPAGVNKEQGVIEQEIHMYKDHPTVRLREDLLRNLYHHHPIRDTILGEVDDIMQINEDLLLACHRTFYHPSNMTVMVTGDVDPETVLERTARAIKDSWDAPGGNGSITRVYPGEPGEVAVARTDRAMQVTGSYAAVALKLPPLVDTNGVPVPAGQETSLMGAIALDALVGTGTPLYQQLYNDGVVTRTFWYRLDVQPGATYVEIAGQTDDPERFIQSFQDALRSAARDGVDKDNVERSRRSALGVILAGLDHPEAINGAFLRDRYLGFDYMATAGILRDLDVDATSTFFQQAFEEERLTAVTVGPGRGGRDD